jgi:hypothetical protein
MLRRVTEGQLARSASKSSAVEDDDWGAAVESLLRREIPDGRKRAGCVPPRAFARAHATSLD